MVELDIVDRNILKLLQVDSSRTIKEIAELLALTSTPVFKRIKRLEKIGLIKGYSAIVNPELLGKKLFAFIQVSLKTHDKNSVNDMMKVLLELDDILECHYVTGGADLLLKVLVSDIEEYNQFITDKLFSVPNIGRVETLLSLDAKKYTYNIPI